VAELGSRMPIDLHPQAAEVLRRLAAGAAERSAAGSRHELARTGHVRSARWLVAPVEDVANTYELSVDSPTGEVGVRIHVPADPRPGCMLYFHGGGWVIGTLDTFDGICRALANRTGLAVVAVDYRMAPEHPYPAAPQDCRAVAEWVAAGAAAEYFQPGPLIVAGDSAGGNLAATLALAARDRGGPRVDAQVLIYPITDAAMASRSFADYGTGLYLTAADMRWYWRSYLGTRLGALDGEFSPLHARKLTGLPPALVITAEYDPLRDEGEAYAERLRAAGVVVSMRRFEGMIHGFFRFTAMCDAANEAFDEVAVFVNRVVAEE
jgi:acetyl esterase